MRESLSVVVANDASTFPDVAEAVASLRSELHLGLDEVIWVDRAGLVPELAEAKYVPVDSTLGRGEMYEAGNRIATHGLRAFTDSTTVLLPGWRSAVLSVFAEGAQIAGGPVFPAPRRSFRYLAGFISEYAFHAIPPYTNATGDVSGNNLAYSRAVLMGVEGALWKTEINKRLMNEKAMPKVAPQMRVMVTKEYDVNWFLRERFVQGVLYSEMRTRTWPAARRAAYAAAAVMALPLVLLVRLVRRVSRERGLRRSLVSTLPFVITGLISWSLGEAAGAVGWRTRGARSF